MSPAGADRLGQLIREARRRRDLRQEDVADRIGVDRSLVSQWERGDRQGPLAPEHVQRLSTTLGVPALELLTAMGYDVRFEGVQDEQEVALLDLFRQAPPLYQRAVLRGLQALSDEPGHEGG